MDSQSTQEQLPYPTPDRDGRDVPSIESDLTNGGGKWPTVPGYQILGELGQGGMGIVYKARQTGLNRLVALKMIRPGAALTPKKLARFVTEAQAIARIQHPNIIQIFDIGELDGLPFYSMEFVAGTTLNEKLSGQPQPWPEAVSFVEVLARGLREIHRQGILHRDLKPSNILLTEDGTPKITDFGLARHLDAANGLTADGEVLGTPSYMAPEQVYGDVNALGPATDLYALGAILYTLLTGRPPFEGESVSILFATINNDPESPRRRRPDIPPALETLCLRCLEKEPTRRYSSADELINDLRQVSPGRTEALSTSPPTIDPTECGTEMLVEPIPFPQRTSRKRSRKRTRHAAPKARSRRWLFVTLSILLLAGLVTVAGFVLVPALGLRGSSGRSGSEQTDPATVYLSDMKPSDSRFWIRRPPAPPDRPPPPHEMDGVMINGVPSPQSLFMHPPFRENGGVTQLSYRLDGKYSTFDAEVSLNDGPDRSETPLTFSVLGDGQELWKSRPVSTQANAQKCRVPVKGVTTLTILVNCPGHPRGAHAVWIEPRVSR